MSRIRLAILGSTRGTDMLPILAAMARGQLPAVLTCVISNKASAMILERAQDHHIPALFIDPANKSRTDYDQLITDELRQRNVELIILIGYMRILSPEFVEQWRDNIINVHPSLLPDFAGGMNNDVHAAVLAAGKQETGCTVHYVTEQVDQGPILIQKRCAVLPTDTVDTLKSRVQELEGQALIESIQTIVARTSAATYGDPAFNTLERTNEK